ncbi:hypothetical protein [Paraburkholderia sp. J8-2]|uniref:hypothetical protein n=1 Tax=Paraburkholderia sp. J8-2 TaxID=2805440 RepID=UPI002AB6D8D6|nr:hypothetical protein [Paraburkholderia sp. J8-2]
MANKVEQFLSSISDDDLRRVLRDYKVQRETGIMPEGAMRGLARDIHERFGLKLADASAVISEGVLRIAAYRWAGL